MSSRSDKNVKENLIKEVRVLSKKLGRTPKKREFEKNTSAIYHFKTWNNFLKEANLNPLKQLDLDVKDIDKFIHDFVNDEGRVPTTRDFNKDMYLPGTKIIEKKYKKSWNEILNSLGYEANTRANTCKHLSNSELLERVEAELIRLGTTKKIEYDKQRTDDSPSPAYLYERLGMSWNDVLKELGMESNVKLVDVEEMIDELRNIAKEIRRTPSVKDLERYGLQARRYSYVFGSYNKALRLADLKENTTPQKVKLSNEELLEEYKSLCKKLGRAAAGKEIDFYLSYSQNVFVIRFGSLSNLKALAGYEEYAYKKKYTKQEIEYKLISIYKNYRRRLTIKELKDLSKEDSTFPSVSTILRYFKTTKINDVWEEIEERLE